MLHVIYHTAYFTNDGAFLSCKELDACFNTIGDEHNYTLAERPQIGCRLLLPKLELNRNISPKYREYLQSKHPDHNLKFASVSEIDDDFGTICELYAIYERYIQDEESGEPYSIEVSIGQSNDVCLHLIAIPTDYDGVYYHTTKWDSVDFECNVKTGDCVHISSNRDVTIFYKDWQINGKWETMEQNSEDDFVYHCRSSLFSFDITISIKRGTWDEDNEK